MSTEVVYGGTGHPQAGQIIATVARPDPPVTPRELRKVEFGQVASAAIGAAVWGGIIKTTLASTDNVLVGAWELSRGQSTLTKNEADTLMSVLVLKTAITGMTAQQKTDILAAWPVL